MEYRKFIPGMNYLYTASSQTRCRDCNTRIPEGRRFFLRIENGRESHYCRSCSNKFLLFHGDPLLCDPDLLPKYSIEIMEPLSKDAREILIAIDDKNIKKIKYLLRNDASLLDARDYQGKTPLHRTAEHGDHEIVQILLEHRAEMEVTDESGRTPLHIAAMYVFYDVVKIFLKSGASVDAKDNLGCTPLHLALKTEKALSLEAVVKLLLKFGADVNAKDISGMTPLNQAGVINNKTIHTLMIPYLMKPNKPE